MKLREAAVALNISLDACYRLVWEGKLKATQVGGRWDVPEEAVEARKQQVVSKRSSRLYRADTDEREVRRTAREAAFE
jgi:excisionase family DNA binding protein